MKSFACYCQKCRAANVPGEDACVNCGTPLMLVTTPLAMRNEMVWSNVASQEHLLERISILELRLVQVADRLSQALDLMMRQTKTAQKEHLLVETLIDALTASGIIENGKFSEIWQQKKDGQKKIQATDNRREQTKNRLLANLGKSDNAEAFARLVKNGFHLIKSGDGKQGVRTLERAAALEPTNQLLLTFIGEYYFFSDKRVLARDYLEKTFQINPAQPRAGLLLGFLMADDGEFDRAKNILEHLVETKSFAVNFILGMIYAVENCFEKTLTAFKRALTILPGAETHYLVGSAWAEAGREKTALRHFQKAVEIDQNFADAWFMLGVIYERSGDEKNAKNALNHSLAAQDATAQSGAILRNPKKYSEIASTTLIFARLAPAKKNLISSAAPRILRLLREDLDKIVFDADPI